MSTAKLGKPGEPLQELRGKRVWLDRMELKDATLIAMIESDGAPVYRELCFLEEDFLNALRAHGYTIERTGE